MKECRYWPRMRKQKRLADEAGLMIKRNRAKERCICYNRNIQSEELEMTSLIKPVPQREIEEKKQGS